MLESFSPDSRLGSTTLRFTTKIIDSLMLQFKRGRGFGRGGVRHVGIPGGGILILWAFLGPLRRAWQTSRSVIFQFSHSFSGHDLWPCFRPRHKTRIASFVAAKPVAAWRGPTNRAMSEIAPISVHRKALRPRAFGCKSSLNPASIGQPTSSSRFPSNIVGGRHFAIKRQTASFSRLLW